MNLDIKYWTISYAGCKTKTDSFTTAVRVGTKNTSIIWDHIFGRSIEYIWFFFSYSEIQKYEQSAEFHQDTDTRGAVSLDHSWQ